VLSKLPDSHKATAQVAGYLPIGLGWLRPAEGIMTTLGVASHLYDASHLPSRLPPIALRGLVGTLSNSTPGPVGPGCRYTLRAFSSRATRQCCGSKRGRTVDSW
jgi:hypothetical protein